MLLARIGVSAKPSAMPIMLARVMRPTAVARSPWANQLAGTLVHASSRNGWEMARPIVQSSTSV